MKKYWLFLLCVGVVMRVSQHVFAEETIFPIESYPKALREFTGYTTFGPLQKRRFTQKETCTIVQEQEHTFLLSPVCFVQTVTTGLEMSKAISLIAPYFHDVNVVYNTSASQFIYEPTSPIFTKRLLPYTFNDDLGTSFLASLQKQGLVIRISDVQLAYLMSKTWSWYAVWKDMTPLKSCTKQNYTVAFSTLSDYVLASGEKLNFNDLIAYRSGYCKGAGRRDLMFY